MNTKLLPLLTVIVPLLACKSGRNLAAEERGENASELTHAAAPSADGRVPLKIVEGKARAENGFVIIPGEVKNDTGKWLRSIRIEVQLFDAAGKLIVVDSIAAAEGRGESVVSEREHVPPGEIALFRYTRDAKKLTGSYASHKLTASGRVGDASMSATVEGVDKTKDEHGFYKVSGLLRSTGPAGCRSPRAVIGLYAADGQLYDVKSADPDEWFQKVLPTGQSAPFERRAIDSRGGVFSEIRVWGDCRR